MSEGDRRTEPRPASSTSPYQDELAAVSLRLLLAQAEINAQSLLAAAGIDAREREAADKLQKLMLEELAPPHQEYARNRRSAWNYRTGRAIAGRPCSTVADATLAGDGAVLLRADEGMILTAD
ncbi:hypothetical protein [Bradyrhizobium sp. sBnM-33]|uniref:hypothetical protein n=1 Tax=Bradyrhizobium sp. sBnM-33 TaxID=2831780 RepID=UPI002899EF7C|nr:hypothetical protein [Bradyrhizobium sp. sBnM-33]WOH49334.1 hypothetical protein RX328_35535 [Bradyrhizobium sp. sBnM-33]